MSIKSISVFFIMGVIPTAIAFGTHSLFCKYAMNPICYLKCIIPLILASPMAMMADEEVNKHDN